MCFAVGAKDKRLKETIFESTLSLSTPASEVLTVAASERDEGSSIVSTVVSVARVVIVFCSGSDDETSCSSSVEEASCPGSDDVVTCSSSNEEASCPGSDDVVICSSSDDVVSCSGSDDVVSCFSSDDVVSCSSSDDVVSCSRSDGLGFSEAGTGSVVSVPNTDTAK